MEFDSVMRAFLDPLKEVDFDSRTVSVYSNLRGRGDLRTGGVAAEFSYSTDFDLVIM
jgi:hypothetical protein